jgi:hypothetical protein
MHRRTRFRNRLHQWSKPVEQDCACVQCGLVRLKFSYGSRRFYRWPGPPELFWKWNAPQCPPDLSTGRSEAGWQSVMKRDAHASQRQGVP